MSSKKLTLLQIFLILAMTGIAIALAAFGFSVINRTLPELKPSPIPTMLTQPTASPSLTFENTEEAEVSASAIPEIYSFKIIPNEIPNGSCAEIFWDVEKTAYQLQIYKNQELIFDLPSPNGSIEYCPESSGILALELKISDANGTSSSSIENIVVSAPTATPTSPLIRDWKLVFYLNEEGVYATPISGTQITIQFFEDYSISGSGDCILYNSGFTAQERIVGTDEYDRLLIDPVNSTTQKCEDVREILNQEKTYLSLLDNVFYYKLIGNQLELMDAAGNKLLIFSRNSQ